MGVTPGDKIARWAAAAGQSGKSAQVIERVTIAGNFLEKTGRLSEKQACDCLSGIDFSHPVRVVRLPNATYVQYVDSHLGSWFTNTGLSPDLVGLAQGRRGRQLFRPHGIVWALQSVARSIKDTWTDYREFQSISPRNKGRMGEHTHGGGVQYFVIDKFLMVRV